MVKKRPSCYFNLRYTIAKLVNIGPNWIYVIALWEHIFHQMEFLPVLIPALGSSSIDPMVISPACLQEVEISPLQCHWLCLDLFFPFFSLWLFSRLFDTLSLPAKLEGILKPRQIDTLTKRWSGWISRTSFKGQFDNRITISNIIYSLITLMFHKIFRVIKKLVHRLCVTTCVKSAPCCPLTRL